MTRWWVLGQGHVNIKYKNCYPVPDVHKSTVSEQSAHTGGVDHGDGQVEGGLSLVVDDVGVGAAPQHEAEDVPGPRPDRAVDAGLALLVRHVRVRAALQQPRHGLQVAALRRAAQRSLASPVLHIEAGPGLQQRGHGGLVAPCSCQVEGGPRPPVH